MLDSQHFALDPDPHYNYMGHITGNTKNILNRGTRVIIDILVY